MNVRPSRYPGASPTVGGMTNVRPSTFPRTGGSAEETTVGAVPHDPFGYFAKGVAVGVGQNPILGQIIDWAPATVRERLDELERRLPNTTSAKIGEFIGEFGPDIAIGAGLFSLGRAAAVRGGQALATGLRPGVTAATRVAPGATGVGAAIDRNITQLAVRGAERALPGLEQAGLQGAVRPGLERALQIAGGSAGIGTQFAAGELAETGDADKAVQEFFKGAAITAGLEGAFTVVPRLLFKGAKEADPFETMRAYRQALGSFPEELRRAQTDKLIKLNKSYRRVFDVENQLRAIRQTVPMSGVLTPAIRQSLAQVPGGQKITNIQQLAEKIGKVREGRSRLGQRRIAAATEIKAAKEVFDAPEHLAVLFRHGPDQGGAIRKAVQRALIQVAKTPEGMMNEQGVALANAVRMAGTSETEVVLAQAVAEVEAQALSHRAATALGVGRREAKDGKFFLPYQHAFERGGEQLLRRYSASQGLDIAKTDEVLKILTEMKQGVDTFINDLMRLGALPADIRERAFTANVREIFPHITEATDDASQYAARVASMVKQGYTEEAAKLKLASSPRATGLARFGNITHQFDSPGTLWEKVNGGEHLIADPFKAYSRFITDAQRRLSYGRRFGTNGELGAATSKNLATGTLGAIRAAAVKEGGQEHVVNAVMDQILNFQTYDQATMRWAQNFLNLQTIGKLPFAWIPGSTQQVNNVMTYGIGQTARGVLQVLRRSNREQLARSAGTFESVYRAINRTFRGQVIQDNLLDRMADLTLRRITPFGMFENFHRMATAATASNMIHDTIIKALKGKLRGDSLDKYRRLMARHGINLSEKVQMARAEAASRGIAVQDVPINALFRPAKTVNNIPVEIGELEAAIFQGVKYTQFAGDVTRRPLGWNSPWGRVVTQFKTYVLSQGRLLRDQVFNEMAKGNLEPMAYFLSVYPVLGEMVRDFQSLAKGKPRKDFDHPVGRILDNYAALGGLGMVTDAIAQAGYGQLADWLGGPTFSDVVTFGSALLTRDSSQAWNQIQRTPAYQYGELLANIGMAVGGVTIGQLMELEERYSESSTQAGKEDMSSAEFYEALRERAQ